MRGEQEERGLILQMTHVTVQSRLGSSAQDFVADSFLEHYPYSLLRHEATSLADLDLYFCPRN